MTIQRSSVGQLNTNHHAFLFKKGCIGQTIHNWIWLIIAITIIQLYDTKRTQQRISIECLSLMNLGSSLIAIKCKMGRWFTARFSAVYIEFWRLVGAGMLRICEVSWLTHRALWEILADSQSSVWSPGWLKELCEVSWLTHRALCEILDDSQSSVRSPGWLFWKRCSADWTIIWSWVTLVKTG